MTKKRNRTKKPIPLVAPPSTKKRQKQSNDENKKKRNSHSQFSNTSESLKLIRDYHTLNKRLEQNARDDGIDCQQRKQNAEKIRLEQQAMGGIEKYQQASMYGAKSSKFVCAHWVEPLLKEHIFTPSTTDPLNKIDTAIRPRILDVGAIDNQYLQYDWFDAVPIDLNAQHKSVVQADFFDYAHAHIEQHQKKKNKPFDAIVLSLVLNFQGDPRRRGDMLALAADARLLRSGGLVYVALPSASLDNSRYCDEDYLIQVCETLGLKVVERKRSAKLALLAFQQTSGHAASSGFQAYNVASKTFRYTKEMSRAPAKAGDTRNNFAVMLKSSTLAR
jgi:25S rRNA (adenine2142-N1)-methyltransferase